MLEDGEGVGLVTGGDGSALVGFNAGRGAGLGVGRLMIGLVVGLALLLMRGLVHFGGTPLVGC